MVICDNCGDGYECECKDVIFEHVPGHSEVELNELVDKLCNTIMDKEIKG